MNKLHKEYRIVKGIEPQNPQLEEQLKNIEPPVFLRISPDASISLSCGEGIDFESCWQRYNAFHSSSYSTLRRKLISELLSSYSSASDIHEGYKKAPKYVNPQTLTIQAKFDDVVSVRDAEIKTLTTQKENVPLRKYQVKPTSPSFLTPRQVVEEDLKREAKARLSKFGVSAPSEQAIQSFVSENIEAVLAMERRNAEELSDYNLRIEQSLAISENAKYQKEHDDAVAEIDSKIRAILSNELTINKFYNDELRSFETYLNTFFGNLQSPYLLDISLDYDQSTSSAKVNISFPDASQCNLPIRTAKMMGKEIKVYEYPAAAINVEYAKSISSIAYSVAVALLDNNPYLSTVIISGTDKSKKNGLFTALFTRSDFKGINLSDDSIERLMSRFIVIADYVENLFAFKPIPFSRFDTQQKSLMQDIASGKKITNTIAVPLAQAQAIVKQVHSATDIEQLIAESVKHNIGTVRIDSKYVSILKELGYNPSIDTTVSRYSLSDNELILVGTSDISSEMTTSTAVDHFLEWRDKKKNVLEMRGVTEVDGGKIRMTQHFVTTRYSSRLLNRFNINAWSGDYVFISRTRLTQLEAAHLPEEYSDYLQEFGASRIEKGKEFEIDGKLPRAIKEYERCLEYGSPHEVPFDRLIALYNQIGDTENCNRVKDLKRKTWG